MTLLSAYSFCCRYRRELWLRELATLMEALVEIISPGEENWCFDLAAIYLILAIINFSFCIIRIWLTGLATVVLGSFVCNT